MTIREKAEVFSKLGIFLEQFSSRDKIKSGPRWLEELNEMFFRPVELVIESSHVNNPWFTEDSMRYALGVTGRSLNEKELFDWLSPYGEPGSFATTRTVAVVMAGNIPMVGLHDMLCVMASPHRLLAKLSARDDGMLKMVAEILINLDERFQERIVFTEGRLKDFDAVIATGSNNTSRYFEYYFGRYPNIIRKNRNSAAILDGSENEEDLKKLADDILRYFGLGCRSVSKLFVPEDYDFASLITAMDSYRWMIHHNNWANNYDYQRAIHLIDQTPHLDTGFLLIREERSLSSPIAVLNYERTKSPDISAELARGESDNIQCIVGNGSLPVNAIPFGKAQEPAISDYADNVNTIDFLLNL